jgi:heme-degrading monooxygenase HmoA
MFARMITYSGAKNIDDGITFVREKALPTVQEQKGYRSLSASVDRANGVLGILSLWETEADRDASQSALASVREDGQHIIGGELEVETAEELFSEVAQPPGPGAYLVLRRVSMDPAKIDENLAFFKAEVVPQIKANSGFCGIRNLIDRETGKGAVGTVWTDEASARAAAADAQSRQGQAASRGVNLEEQSFREIVFADFR